MVTTTTWARPESTPLPQTVARMDASRLRAYRENLEFYRGRQWLDPLRRWDRRLTLNYAKTVVEKTASYTMSGLSFVVDPEDGSAESGARARAAERALHDVYEANGLEQLDCDNEIDCSVLGDAAYKVTWDPSGEGLGRCACRRRMCRGSSSGPGATIHRGCGGWRRATRSGTRRRRC